MPRPTTARASATLAALGLATLAIAPVDGGAARARVTMRGARGTWAEAQCVVMAAALVTLANGASPTSRPTSPSLARPIGHTECTSLDQDGQLDPYDDSCDDYEIYPGWCAARFIAGHCATWARCWAPHDSGSA